jgi:hypothetical protein
MTLCERASVAACAVVAGNTVLFCECTKLLPPKNDVLLLLLLDDT